VLLAIDLGNTNLKCGLFRDQTLLGRWRSETIRAASAAALAEQLRGWVAEQPLAPIEIRAAVIASVVPVSTPALLEAVRLAFACEPLLVSHELNTGITLRGPSPLELGADRLVNAVAARALAQLASAHEQTAAGSLVVDLGTATKLDCVSPAGEFLGGVIAPGVVVSLEALVARAARLRSVELRAPQQILGRSTVECVQSGLLHGHASLVDGLLGKLRAELPFPVEVIATGGLAPLIAPLTASLRRIEPDLTLHGLRSIHERNPR
jgi:type III pantothenate kinase